MEMSYYKSLEPFWGSWYISKKIGEGAYGKVFEVVREEFGRQYHSALKIITVPQSDSEWESALTNGMDELSVTSFFKGFVDEIINEIALMNKLKGHSNIVSYEDHAVIEHADHRGWDIIMRMELLTPLLSAIPKDGFMSRDNVIKLGIDMCKALEYCQTLRVVHRDIKPENIFITDSGDYKLGDFGVARTIEKTVGALSKKGTYTYMAPELYKGQDCDTTVDIYSLGIVLYRYLNKNRAPFLPPYGMQIKHSDVENALNRRMSGEALPIPADAQDELGYVVLKACAYNPRDRYQTAGEMRQALERYTGVSNDVKETTVTPDINIATGIFDGVPSATGVVATNTGVDNGMLFNGNTGMPVNQAGMAQMPPVNGSDQPYAVNSSPVVMNDRNTVRSDESKKNNIFVIAGIFVAAVLIAIVGISAVLGNSSRVKGDTAYYADNKETQNYQDEKDDSSPTPQPTSKPTETDVTSVQDTGSSVETEQVSSADFDFLYNAADDQGEIYMESNCVQEGDTISLRFSNSNLILSYASDLHYKSDDESIGSIRVSEDKQRYVFVAKKTGQVNIKAVFGDCKADREIKVVEQAGIFAGNYSLSELYKDGAATKSKLEVESFGEESLTIDLDKYFTVDLGGGNQVPITDMLGGIYCYGSENIQISVKGIWNADNSLDLTISDVGGYKSSGEITLLVMDQDEENALCAIKIPYTNK